MIASVFLTLGVGGTAAVIYAVAPAGRGLHRYVVPRSRLRADLARADAVAEELTTKLVGLVAELDAVVGERDEARALLGKAEQLVTDTEADAKRLREANQALKARLANATAIRPLAPVTPLTPPATPTPSSVVVPLHAAPLPHSPAAEPS
ncbi:hypothetical protein [Streptomyces sp. Amel2xC10]|uniref:hypothetical protein n=1 Tax=Streptomyces sp. Amel2xC10 TaxID=1305826 RepID=UPI000A081F67|nr:hypothetical protein [Streptomyces sp. Amel2xC10]SMF85983.1 hypothetical protein SAMN02745830_07098 [Streptomyces sp. Amel2xC10]